MVDIQNLHNLIDSTKAAKDAAINKAYEDIEVDVIAPKFKEYDEGYEQIRQQAARDRNEAIDAAEKARTEAIKKADDEYANTLKEAQETVDAKKKSFADDQKSLIRIRVCADYDALINELNAVAAKFGG